MPALALPGFTVVLLEGFPCLSSELTSQLRAHMQLMAVRQIHSPSAAGDLRVSEATLGAALSLALHCTQGSRMLRTGSVQFALPHILGMQPQPAAQAVQAGLPPCRVRSHRCRPRGVFLGHTVQGCSHWRRCFPAEIGWA